MIQVQHAFTDKGGSFYYEQDGKRLAEMVYITSGSNKMIIEHTEVDKSLRGQNVGIELVHAAVEFARHHGMKIIPICSFAKQVLDKKVEWQDVLETGKD